MKSHPITRAACLCVLMPVLTSCITHHLRPTPTLDLPQDDKLPLRAALVVPPELREREDVYGRYGTLGFANKWVSNTGEGLAPALEETARSVFREVEVVSSADSAQDADVVLLPKVVELRQMSERSGFWITFQLSAVARDKAGKVRLEKTYSAVEEGSMGAAFWGGAFAAAAVLTSPTEKAMANTLLQLSIDLRQIAWNDAATNAP